MSFEISKPRTYKQSIWCRLSGGLNRTFHIDIPTVGRHGIQEDTKRAEALNK